jgi:DNA-binding CsgD family transcriptional regulator
LDSTQLESRQHGRDARDTDLPVNLTTEDISAVLTLVHQTCDHWDDPPAWRNRLLQGACALLNGSVGIMVVDDAPKAHWFGRPHVISVVGLPDGALRTLVQPAFDQFEQRRFDDASANLLPGITALHADIERQGWVTAAGNQLAHPDDYHASPHYRDFRRPIGSDDYVVSIRIVDVPRRPEAITIDRPQGATPFGPREVALLKLLHDQIAPLIGVRLATEHHLCRSGLSRRLNQTLSLLLEGQSEKQVARQLSLSPRTIHDYVTTLYEHFKVSSRAELLAYFIRRTPTLRPARRV